MESAHVAGAPGNHRRDGTEVSPQPFEGRLAFCSNFYPIAVRVYGVDFLTSEHAYQSWKMASPLDAATVAAQTTPGRAKRKAKLFAVRHDWCDEVKVALMLDVLRAKFAIPAMRDLLLATGDEPLVEINFHHDVFWGVCNGVGRNMLGLLLMQVRSEIQSKFVP